MSLIGSCWAVANCRLVGRETGMVAATTHQLLLAASSSWLAELLASARANQVLNTKEK